MSRRTGVASRIALVTAAVLGACVALTTGPDARASSPEKSPPAAESADEASTEAQAESELPVAESSKRQSSQPAVRNKSEAKVSAKPVTAVDVSSTPVAPAIPAASLPSGADKSGVTSQAISLPSTSGSIQGMGESFSAQLSTGIATFSVPFSLPSARGAAQPSLGLSYSSSAGFGAAGVGWDLPVPFIARQTDRGTPKYNDGTGWHPERDRLVFNGGQELIPICTVGHATLGCAGKLQAGEELPAWATGWEYYRPRVEGSFLRFFWNGSSTWRVQSKTGVTMELGVPLNETTYTAGLERNPDALAEIYRWHLVRQYDTHGDANPKNVVVYRYTQNSGRAYLTDIYDTTPKANPTTTTFADFAHHTHLVWQVRPDPTFSFRPGWRIDQRWRLATVEVASKTFDNAGGFKRVRKYHLTYNDSFHVSLLEKVEVEGRCAGSEASAPGEGAAQACAKLPPMTFEYTHVKPQPGKLGFEDFVEKQLSLGSSPKYSLDEALTDLFDVNSDALPDVVVTAPALFSGKHGLFVSGAAGATTNPLGLGFSATTIALDPAGIPAGTDENILKLSNTNVSVFDLDGDGRANLVHMPIAKKYEVLAPELVNGAWQWKGRSISTASAQDVKIDFTNESSKIRVFDVDSDGLVDVVVTTGTQMQTFFALGRYPSQDGQFGKGTRTGPESATASNDPVTSCLPWSATPIQFSDPDVFLGDMNGDGITDIVRVRAGEIRYWPGRGNGFWGTGIRNNCPSGTFGQDRHIAMTSSPNFGVVGDGKLLLDDVNGDGLSDLVEVRFNAVDVYLNVNGESWTDRHILYNTPPKPAATDRVRLVDVDGSGTRDILWGDGYDYKYIDLAGGVRPWLLAKVQNGLGKTTAVEYSTSTAEMLAAEATPATWATRMPTVAHVVKKVTEQDGLGGAYVTEYTYGDPGFDGQQREFRGFARASARRLGDVNSPTDVTDSRFLLGECLDETPTNATPECSLPERWRDNPREALKGLPWLTERRDESGRYLQTESNRYVLRELYKGLDGRVVRHAHVAETSQTLYDTAQPTTASTLTSVNAVTLEVNGTTTDDTAVNVPTRAASGLARTRSTFVVDGFGNRTLAKAFGCESGDACLAADEEIWQHTLAVLPPGDPTKWNWRTSRTFVTGKNHGTTEWKDTRNTYDANGDLIYVHAQLAGSLGVDRSVAGSVPTGLSTDGLKLIANKTYDQFGNVTDDVAPVGGGQTERCRQISYDTAFADLPVTETIFRGGCGTAPLTTQADFDRGLELASEVRDWNAQPARMTYDHFGRLTALTRPLPGGGAGTVETVKLAYFLPPDLNKPYSAIHSMTQDGGGPAEAKYLESVSFVDGMGRTRATLKEADQAAGDGGNWVAGGFVDFDSKGALRRKYLEVFYTGAWQSFDVSVAPSTPYGRQRYDAFGRQLQTFDIDGTVTLQSVYHALSTDLFDAADILPGPHQGTPATERRDGHGRAAVAIERFRENGSIIARETRTTYLPTGEPEVIERVRAGTNDKVVRWMRYDTLGRMVLNVEPHTTVGFTADPTANPDVGQGVKAWRYAYNDQGELRATSDARGCGSSFFYDGAGRLAGEDYAPCVAGQHEAYSAPTVSTLTGLEVIYLYDGAPATPVTGLEPPAGFSTGFSVGRPVAVFDRGSAVWSRYDGVGRKIEEAVRVTRPNMTGPLAGRYAPRWYYKTVAFDAADREVKASTGATVADLLGTNGESAVETTYTNRGAVGGVAGSYGSLVNKVHRTADGLIESIEYGDIAKTTTDFFFDNRRRLKNVQTYRGPPPQWSALPAVIQPAPISGSLPTFQLLLQDEDFAYDSVNNPVEIRDWRIADEWPAGAKPVTRKVQYDDLNRVRRVDYQYAAGDDTWTSPFEAENSGTAALLDPRRATPSPHSSFAKRPLWQAFEYDWLGNTSKTDDDVGGFYDRSLGSITNNLTNGKPYQLAAASNKSGTSTHKGELSAKYDAAGHLVRLALERTGPCLPTPGGCNQIFEYQWDEVGRLAEAARWDLPTGTAPPADGIPTGAVLGAKLRHAYDAGDERVLKTAIDSSGAERHTVYVFGSLELRRAAYGVFGSVDDADYELSKTTEVPYLFANGVRLARVAWEDLDVPSIGQSHLHVLFELGDHLGSTSVVLDRATSELVEKSTFQAYGAAESDYRPPRWAGFREDYRFTGKEEDVEVGLQYFGKRYYAPLLNRWVSADPLGIHAPGRADLNLYAYVRGQALKATDPRGLDCGGGSHPDCDPSRQTTIDDVTIEGAPAPFDQSDEQLSSNAEMLEAFRAMEAGDKERAADILFGRSAAPPPKPEPDMAAAFANGALSIATFDWAHEEPRLPSKPLLGGSAADVEYGSTLGLFALGSVGDALALSGATVQAFRSVQTRSFFTVQGEGDASRLLAGGTPWPSGMSRANLGEGLYTWGARGQAEAYKAALEARGATGLRIMEGRMSAVEYRRLRTLDLRRLDDAAVEEWMATHSQYGEGLPHPFQHVIRETGNFGSEHYFSADVFSSFKF